MVARAELAKGMMKRQCRTLEWLVFENEGGLPAGHVSRYSGKLLRSCTNAKPAGQESQNKVVSVAV